MKAVKVVAGLVVLLLIIGVGVALYLVSNLNDIVKDVIESEGPKITQTEVTLDSVDIQLRQGRGEITGFEIANPREFDSSNVMSAERLVLEIEPSSVMDDVIVIRDVVVHGVTMTAEQKGMTTNIQTMLKSIRDAAPSDTDAPARESDVRLMVEKISFADSSLQLVTEEHGDYQLDLPGLELTDIGSRENGLAPAELGRAILEPALAQAREAAQDKLENAVRDEAENRLKEKAKEKLGDSAEERLKELRGLMN